MNDKFFQLPAQKQKRILNAAYKAFAQSPYKKSVYVLDRLRKRCF